MTTRFYKSTDLGAPVLTGQADSLIALLKAILVNGIGGTPAAPWTIPYENVAAHSCVFRPPQGNRHYLRVLEDGATAAGQREAALRGYGNMTDHSTGTDPFPSTTQQAGGLVVRKSNTADSTPRQWRALVDEKTFYLFIDCGDVTGTWDAYVFGQFLDWTPNGAWGSCIGGRVSSNSTTHSSTTNSLVTAVANGTSATKLYGPRDYTQASPAVEYTVHYDASSVNTAGAIVPGSIGQPYPYPVDSGVLIMPARLALAGFTVGRLRGLWIPGHNRPLVQDDTFNATEGTLTRSFTVQNFLTTGQWFVETSSTWDSE